MACAQRLRVLCRGAVVLKGGHADDSSQSVDWVVAAERSARLASERLAGASHGTGCVFSAVLAGMLAQGWDVLEAATEAKLRVHAGIAQGSAIGPGRLNTNPDAKLTSDHLPTFHWIPGDESLGAPMPFARTIAPLGFYPIVDSADWVERLLAWGVRTIQLRIKQGSLPEAELKAQLAAAVRAAREIAGAQLFVNDHWRDAIELGAYGVHLGQEDLANADLSAMNASGLRLGVSSHTPNLEQVMRHAVYSGRFQMLLVAYNFKNWPDLTNIFRDAKSRGIGVVAMKTLKGARATVLKDFAGGKQAFSQAAFKWVLSNPDVSGLVVSIQDFQQIDEYLYASGQPLTGPDLARLEEYDRRIAHEYCRPGCGQCLDSCPNGVPVDDVFRFAMYHEDYGWQRHAREQYARLAAHRNASRCAGCPAPCEAACPFQIAIREKLVRFDRLLG